MPSPVSAPSAPLPDSRIDISSHATVSWQPEMQHEVCKFLNILSTVMKNKKKTKQNKTNKQKQKALVQHCVFAEWTDQSLCVFALFWDLFYVRFCQNQSKSVECSTRSAHLQ